MMLLSGLGLSVQSGINGELGKRLGSVEGAFFSFFIGTVALTLFMLFFGKGNILEVFRVPKWQLIGGLLGAAYITAMVVAVPKLGVGLSVVTVIVGQILSSLVIDHFGWFGKEPIPLDWNRGIGVILLLAGLCFIFRGSLRLFP
jgi:transporter family-2 protein